MAIIAVSALEKKPERMSNPKRMPNSNSIEISLKEMPYLYCFSAGYLAAVEGNAQPIKPSFYGD